MDSIGTLVGDSPNLLNWSSNIAVEDWDGITVGGTPGRVIQLELSHKELAGVLPSSLEELAGLQLLDLSNNLLNGTIPEELFNLSNLRELNLRFNSIGGEIPAEIGQLSRLQHLDLGGNDLSGGIPVELSELAGLQYLSLCQSWRHCSSAATN